jgi:hypothetical protein
MCQYRRICRNRRIFIRFILQINCGRCQWRHYHDLISQVYYCQLKFDCVWWSMKFNAFWWFTILKLIVKLLEKWKLNVWHITSFRTPTSFFHFLNKNYFCSNITKFANIAEFFWQKTFGDIGPPPVDVLRYRIISILRTNWFRRKKYYHSTSFLKQGKCSSFAHAVIIICRFFIFAKNRFYKRNESTRKYIQAVGINSHSRLKLIKMLAKLISYLKISPIFK